MVGIVTPGVKKPSEDSLELVCVPAKDLVGRAILKTSDLAKM